MAAITPETESSPKATQDQPVSFLGRFTILRGSSRELWVIFGSKILAILSYAIMNSMLVVWLSSDLGYSDKAASQFALGWSAVMTLFTVFVGSFTDALGLKKTILLGVGVCAVARMVMTFTMVPSWALLCGLLPLAMGEALVTPVMVAAIQRYASFKQRPISFSIFYAMMNVGFFLAGWLSDFIRQALHEYQSYAVPVLGIHLSAYRTIFLFSFLFTVPNFLLLWFGLREGIEATDNGPRVVVAASAPRGPSAGVTILSSIRQTAQKSVQIFKGLWGQPGFFKFLAFLAFAAMLRLVIMHMYYTYPKFGIRELGPGAPIGKLFWSVNSILIIVLVPIIGAVSQKISAYRMVVWGTVIASASVFVMAMPPHWFQPLADGEPGRIVGRVFSARGPVSPYYLIILLYSVCWSVGEAMYSPRLYEYAGAIAPKGQEASYMAMSYLPFFLAKIVVLGISGSLLAKYCPAEGIRHSATLWLIIALMTSIGPIGLIAFKKYIHVKEEGRE